SVAHLGIAAVGVGLLEADGRAGAGLYIASHAAVKMSLFLGAGILLHRYATMQLTDLAGKGRAVWPLAGMFTIGGLVLAGGPPSGLFAGKGLIEEAAEKVDLGWVVVLLYLAAALTGAAVIRVVLYLLRTDAPRESSPIFVREGSRETYEKGGIVLMSVIVAVLLVAGILMPLIGNFVGGLETVGEDGFDRKRYVSSVLTGTADPVKSESSHDLWKLENLAKGSSSAVFAVLVGVLVASRHRLKLELILGWLRRLHSGHVGDYVVWLTIGSAGIIGWLLWRM
ncbi:MAG: proton-conducting transporter membrane subunit, partial [Limisphaerales bacterium]